MRAALLPVWALLLLTVIVASPAMAVTLVPNSISGTVVSVGDGAVTWRTDSGEERTVTLDGISTAYTKLQAGDRVSVHYHPVRGGTNRIVTMVLMPSEAAPPATAEVKPELDSDGDGVTDTNDRCAGTPRGCTVDASGCPSDSDGDGVCDGLDKCAASPKGCVVDAGGCPVDTDGDGVYDGIDRCPDTAQGTRVDKFGCPVTEQEQKLIETGSLRLEGVKFQTGKAVIEPSSYATLDAAAQALVKYPDLRVEIGGHTDTKGTAAKNQTLSEARAKAVRDYLLNKFPSLNADNLTAVGYGQTVPVADNKTDAGRAENRRVEFKVMNPEVLH